MSGSLKSLYLLEVLRELTDAEHRLTVPQLVEALSERGVEMERKSLYRYLEALAEYGFDVVKTGAGYYLGTREYAVWEIKLLCSAVQAATFITQPRTDELCKKLASRLSRYQRGSVGAGAIGGAKCGTDDVYRTIEAVDAAIAAHRRISFYYRKRDISKRSVIQRGGRRYLVSPYAMVWVQDRYYLVCNVDGHDGLTHFRMDRIYGVAVTQQPWRHFSEVSEYRTSFNVADYAAHCLNMFGGTPERITLSCDAALMDELLDRFGADIPVQPGSDGRFTCTVSAVPGDGFLNWAAQFGERVEILSPTELRAQMKLRLEAALKKYE